MRYRRLSKGNLAKVSETCKHEEVLLIYVSHEVQAFGEIHIGSNIIVYLVTIISWGY